MDNKHPTFESKLVSESEHYEHVPVTQNAFNRRHSLVADNNNVEASRRGSLASIKKSFDATNVAMVFPIGNHLEMEDDASTSNSIDDIGAGWFVWLVAFTASIAGSLFGYDTGIISAVLVYLGTGTFNEDTPSPKQFNGNVCLKQWLTQSRS